MQVKENRHFWQKASIFMFLLAGVAALVTWVSVAQSAGAAGFMLYLPIVQRHIPPTPTPTPVPGYISGGVSYNSNPAAGIKVELVKYQTGGNTTVVQTATTDSSGNYVFYNVPALASGYAYYARFMNSLNGYNEDYLRHWLSIAITSYNGTSIAQFPRFDILGIYPISPNGETWTGGSKKFTWQKRPFTNDRYAVAFTQSFNGYIFYDLQAYVDNATLNYPSSLPNGDYFWYMLISISGVGSGAGWWVSGITLAGSSSSVAPTGMDSADGWISVTDTTIKQQDAFSLLPR